ncbi:MAG: hypothetical protein IT195_02525 [Microthrixaceae bacterium]|nr:hypothetical protein [Microthrixaceae bacterium]
MVPLLRDRLVSRWLGGGFTGALGAGVIGWGLRKLREGLRREPELLDVSKLVPGETYTITTKPAPRRRERKLAQRVVKAERKARRAGRVTTPTPRGQRRLAELDSARSNLQAAQDASLAKARRKAPPTRRRTFR